MATTRTATTTRTITVAHFDVAAKALPTDVQTIPAGTAVHVTLADGVLTLRVPGTSLTQTIKHADVSPDRVSRATPDA